jgi:energy-converting hydrogenase Eha subunit A
MIDFWFWKQIVTSKTTCATSGAETAIPSGAPEFFPFFSEVRVARSLVFCVVFCRSFVCIFFFGYPLVSSDYPFGIFWLPSCIFWLPLWYLLITLLYLLITPLVSSDYPIGIFWLPSCIFWLPLWYFLITSFVSSDYPFGIFW